MAELSPMMQHYMKTKDEYKDCILFYRLGDFYEMFFDDAILVSRELELTLTGKACGLEEKAPMCGVPFHAADIYINRLVSNGHKVAICEQVEDPKASKGIVKREVIRIATPGTNLDITSLDDDKYNYLMCILYVDNKCGISLCDVTTGDFLYMECNSLQAVNDQINSFRPSEIICNEAFLVSGIDINDIKDRLGIIVYSLESRYFDDDNVKNSIVKQFNVSSLESLGLNIGIGVSSAGALLTYLFETQKTSLGHISRLVPYSVGNYMILDSSTRRNLELCETLREKQKKGSLLWVLDKTKTAMGSRMLRSFTEQPLINEEDINNRLDAVAQLYDKVIDREELREYLNPVYDLERLLSKISYKSANPKDLLSFKLSLSYLPAILNILKANFDCKDIMNIISMLDPLEDICSLLEASIEDEAPLTIKEGNIIKKGFNEEVDRLKSVNTDGKRWLSELEERDRERTGIKNLRIRYNKVFGYYFEVTNSYKDLVPDDYIRKQTLTGAERYTNDELKNLEDSILNAEDRLFSLEYNLFSDIRDTIFDNRERVQKTARAIAVLDAYLSLAHVAEQNNYVRPKINKKGVIDIKGGRHPVVEKMTGSDSFVPNDTLLDQKKNRLSVITGPNMAGKSTYMRQNALIVLMAQMGSFVPAKSANIGIVDRIFTRVGASDDLSSGRSTFMVEMSEVSNILRNATKNSFIILDEIGRGTSTFDGLSIAWAVVEYISNEKNLGAKTLFATHYHELTELEGKLDGVNNYCIAVKENGDDIVFLRKIIKGGADKSYGIDVARLAGVPDTVLKRAREIANELVDNDISQKIRDMADMAAFKEQKSDEVELNQMSFLNTQTDEDILEDIKKIDISHMTPVEALIMLEKLQSRIVNRWG